MSKEISGLSFYKRKKKISYKNVHDVISWILSIFAVVFIGVAIVMLFGMKTYMVGISMSPSIESDQTILIDRFSYVLSRPKAGDVIIFLPNGNTNSHYYTKRIVAVPGDKVLIENGKLYVNGEQSQIVDKYISYPGIAETELTLESDEYFVMGDIPSDSEDSRSTGVGPVSRNDIVGRVWFKLRSAEGDMGFVK